MVTPIAPWKLSLQPASYNGVVFHVEVGSRSGGRRQAMHEFPKKDIPYAEDMGRRARTYNVTAYLIGGDFETTRDLLVEQLEVNGNGNLVLPTMMNIPPVVSDHYTVTERREQGGYCVVEMMFLEAGQSPSTQSSEDTQATVNNTANSVSGGPSFQDSTNTFMQSNDITSLT